VRQGDVRVAITSVSLGKVEVSSFGGKSESEEELLAIRLRVENLSETRKVEYSGWGDSSGFLDTHVRPSRITSAIHTPASVFAFASRVEGQVSSASIHPGKSVEDVVVFEEPVARAEYLRLELPAAAVRGTGKLRFQIPKEMIERR
jgi:hypothetical protein